MDNHRDMWLQLDWGIWLMWVTRSESHLGTIRTQGPQVTIKRKDGKSDDMRFKRGCFRRKWQRTRSKGTVDPAHSMSHTENEKAWEGWRGGIFRRHANLLEAGTWREWISFYKLYTHKRKLLITNLYLCAFRNIGNFAYGLLKCAEMFWNNI